MHQQRMGNRRQDSALHGRDTCRGQLSGDRVEAHVVASSISRGMSVYVMAVNSSKLMGSE